jgi:uncharacterized membrane protein YdbT with pleckstrin-like domain
MLVWIRVKSSSYRLTSQRLFVRRGWWSRQVNELELYRVKDVMVDQRGLQRLLGYGTIKVLDDDDTTPEVDLVRISRPMKVKRNDPDSVPSRAPARGRAPHRVHAITLSPT